MRFLAQTSALVLFSLLPAAAQNAGAGRAIFEGKGGCVKCHSVDLRGGSLGPDLTEIGVERTPESLRISILKPDAEIDKEYLTAVLTTRQNQRIEGILLNQDDLSVQIRDIDGNPRSFLKENLKDFHREQRSLMPSYASRLSTAEVGDLVAYLQSLRGKVEPHQAAARERDPNSFADSAAWMNRANRDSQELPDTLLDNLRIPTGATVADVGAGTGYFTWRLAQRVGPAGKVLAIEIRQEMLALIAAEAKKHNVENVDPILGTDRDPRLPAGAVDLAFIANAYHEFSQPEAMMTAIRQALKPDGRLVVIEYAKEREDDDPTAGVSTMSATELRSEMESFGFKLERILNVLPSQHAMIFTKQQ